MVSHGLFPMTDPAAVAPQEQPQEEVAKAAFANFAEGPVLKGHNLAVTSLQLNAEGTRLVSTSRDKSALVWDLPRQQNVWAQESVRLEGHNHIVSGVALSSDSTHVLTSSWDKTIRLWEIASRQTKALFQGHTKDVLDVIISPDNRRIISSGRDNTVRLWTIHGECRATLPGESWATKVACAVDPAKAESLYVAASYWDGSVKVWRIDGEVKLLYTKTDAHKGRALTLAFNPDGSYLITGGSDHKVNIFETASGNLAMTLNAPGVVNCVAACPTRTWVCAATYNGVAVFDLTTKKQIDIVRPDFKPLGKRAAGRFPDCTSIAWTEDGSAMYTGYNNGEIRVWHARSQA